MFGPEQPVILHLIEIEPALPALNGVVMELEDCAFPLLKGIVPTASLDEGFKGVAEAAGMATTPQQSKAFVRETRPAEVQYIPVGSSVTRTAPRKPVDDYKKIESELEAKQKANEAAGETAKSLGATPPPEPAKVQPQN